MAENEGTLILDAEMLLTAAEAAQYLIKQVVSLLRDFTEKDEAGLSADVSKLRVENPNTSLGTLTAYLCEQKKSEVFKKLHAMGISEDPASGGVYMPDEIWASLSPDESISYDDFALVVAAYCDDACLAEGRGDHVTAWRFMYRAAMCYGHLALMAGSPTAVKQEKSYTNRKRGDKKHSKKGGTRDVTAFCVAEYDSGKYGPNKTTCAVALSKLPNMPTFGTIRDYLCGRPPLKLLQHKKANLPG